MPQRTQERPIIIWWVSTPQWTIQVWVQGEAIVWIAPLMRRAWHRHSWPNFRRWVDRLTQGSYQAIILERLHTKERKRADVLDLPSLSHPLRG